MKILSIIWSTSTAALMIDGEIVACVGEERFSRVKNEDAYPLHAIESVLRIANIKSGEIDLVVFSGERFDAEALLCHKHSRFSIQDRLKEQRDYWYPRLLLKKDVSFLDVFKDKLDTKQYPGDWGNVLDFIKNGDKKKANEFYRDFRKKVVSGHLGIDPRKIIFAHHHRAHGYYAYYGSPLKKDRTLILTADAWGDDMNASVSLADEKGIKLLSSSTDFMIGRLYRYITLILGMKPDEHEYKVMGLAAYAKPKYYQKELSVFENTMRVDGLGFTYKERPSDLYFYFRDKFEASRFDAVAGAIQKYTENILVEWVSNALKKTKTNKICFGGGVAMNIKAIMEIAKLPELKEIFICPTPSDESLAIGAAYVAMHDVCVARKENPRFYLKPLANAYLGPQASAKEINDVIKKAREKGYFVQQGHNLKYIAGLIAKGKVIGRCVGRSEFGARALGNRSIIADPRNVDIIKVINERIKCRDFWMPFAPSVLEEKADKYILNPKKLKAPYMTIAFETKKAAWGDLKAGLHQYDLTARPQIVTKDANSGYHSLISEFCKLTGVGGVLNTSFNIHGEPIVQTPDDAFSVFERSKLDALMLDGYLIEQKK